MLTLLCPCAFALNPSLDVSQYAHNAWTIRDGFLRGHQLHCSDTRRVSLLVTESACFDSMASGRLNGHRRAIASSEHIVSSLLVTSDGALSMGTSGGIASWKGARLTRYPELDGREVWSLVEDRDGTVWAGSLGVPTGPLCAIRKGATECYGADGSIGRMVLSLFQDRAGNLWAGARPDFGAGDLARQSVIRRR